MARVFDEILAKGVRSGQIPARSKAAREWYRNTAKDYSSIKEHELMKGGNERLTNNPRIGSMYMFQYDAKHKATLPFWDRFPLIFPFRSIQTNNNKGFLGINLHYLPHNYRAILMDALYETTNNQNYDENTKLILNYKILSSSSKYKYFKPCVKHYLHSHLKSRMLYIYPSEWDMAMFLPLERFQKASKQTVWAASRKAIAD